VLGSRRKEPARQGHPGKHHDDGSELDRRSLQTAAVDGEDAADPRGQAQGEMGDDVDDGQDGGPLVRRRQRDDTAPPPARTNRAAEDGPELEPVISRTSAGPSEP